MGDLLWEQVIDYGDDFKMALTARIKAGLLSEESIKIFEDEFPDALVRDGKDKIIGIDWKKTVVPREIEGKDGKLQFESSLQAANRGIETAKTIATLESIPVQAVNSIGMKKVRA